MNNKRLIKNEFTNNSFKNKEISNLHSNNQTMHPIASTWAHGNNHICLTKYQILNNTTQIFNNYKCKNNSDNYKNFLFLPPIGLTSDDIIKIYNLGSIDMLYEFIIKNLDINSTQIGDNLNYITVTRIVNCWIRVNFDTLKNYNNFLVKIISKLFKFYYKNSFNIPKIDEEIKDYVEYWMNKNSGTEFRLNLIEDFYNFIIKKFKLKSNIY